MPKSDRWIVVRSLKNIAWINSVLDSYKALSLKQLEISFHLYTDSYSQLLTKWLHFAFSRRAESLKLYFASERSSGCRLFLKELRLERLSVSGEATEWFLHNCPLLEVLIIDATLITSDLVVVGGMLKHLEVYSSDFEISFRVSAPNLTRLKYSFDLGKLFLKNVSNLVEASFGLCGSLDATRHLTNAAPRLETLTIALSCPSIKERFYHNDFLFEGGTFDGGIFEVPKVGGSPHHHLNVFEFSGFCYDAADHMELVSYIVDHCVALHEIITIPIYPSYCLEREISPGVVLPSRFSANPYVVKYRLYDPTYDPNVFTPFTVDHDVIASARRDASLNIKKCTEQLLAAKVPHHIKLLVV